MRGTRVPPLMTVALAVMIVVSGCSSGGDTRPTRSASPRPPASSQVGTVAPKARLIPLRHRRNVTMRWWYEKGARPQDPVVEVARRVTALVQMGLFSKGWAGPATIRAAIKAVTTRGVFDRTNVKSWSTPVKHEPRVILPVVVGAPMKKERGTTIYLCVGHQGVPSLRSKTMDPAFVLVRVDVALSDGVWRATNYDPDDDQWSRAFYDRCEARFSDLDS